MKQTTKEWLEKANDDIQVIENIIHDDHLTNMVAFHAQQAVEKCLKAVMEEHEMDFVKLHSLEVLYKKIKNAHSLEVDLKMLQTLDQVYISSRYPGDIGLIPSGKPSRAEAATFATFAREFYQQAHTSLSVP